MGLSWIRDRRSDIEDEDDDEYEDDFHAGR